MQDVLWTEADEQYRAPGLYHIRYRSDGEESVAFWNLSRFYELEDTNKGVFQVGPRVMSAHDTQNFEMLTLERDLVQNDSARIRRENEQLNRAITQWRESEDISRQRLGSAEQQIQSLKTGMNEWEPVWIALGRPVLPGQSKAAAALNYVRRLLAQGAS